MSEPEFRRLDTTDRISGTGGYLEIYLSVHQAHMMQARCYRLPASWTLRVKKTSYGRAASILTRYSCRLFIEFDGSQFGWSAKGQGVAALSAGNVGLCVAEHDEYIWTADFASFDYRRQDRTRRSDRHPSCPAADKGAADY